MNYFSTLLIKFIIMTGVLWVILGLMFEIPFVDILITSLVLTGVSFIVGDLYVLPKIGNVGAAMMDFILTLAGVWALGAFLFEEPSARLGTIALVSAFGIALGEILVHWYIKTQSTGQATRPGYYETDLQTEFSDELEPSIKKKNK